MNKTVIIIIIILGVIILTEIISNAVKESVKTQGILEKKLGIEWRKLDNFGKGVEVAIDEIANSVSQTNTETEKSHEEGKYIKETSLILLETYRFACELYKEREILIKYNQICHKIYDQGLTSEFKQKLKAVMNKYDEFIEVRAQQEQKQMQERKIENNEKQQEVFSMGMEW